MLGALLHLGSLTTRGLAADRLPWGNMYEFSSSVAFTAVVAFLVLLAKQAGRRHRRRVRHGAGHALPGPRRHGALHRGRAARAGPQLVLDQDPRGGGRAWPAARSCCPASWRCSTCCATGTTRWSAAAGAPKFPLSLGQSLPSAPALDRAAYAVIAFAFPVWTFAIIAGAIWAEAAWGRYWGWDPKETWSFITWVLYAGYLHARATAGWKGRKAAWIAVAAAVALIIDYYVVNIFVVGLHSYA